ncbi:hypothetical protein [Gelria sp. Kuro-4]|uniref:hypothetical protein n=1 Tax=Gelria sp. Kuro-4 TaxID=2796927 RepID=UPI001BF03362|nr:hypothetical protein [Gelria sp. Kuro-4]BCV25640.1 hypothetical protein kuro4_24130 [Gelria sp. Kuro-4]
MLKAIFLYLGFLVLAGLWRSQTRRRSAPPRPAARRETPAAPCASASRQAPAARRAARPEARKAAPSAQPPVRPGAAVPPARAAAPPAAPPAVPAGGAAEWLVPENLVAGIILAEVLDAPRTRRPWPRR